MLDEGNDVLLAGARRFEQQGGNPLFRAEFTAVGRNRSFHSVVEQRRFRLTFQQIRTPDDNEPLGEPITEATRQGLQQVVAEQQINPADYSLLIAIHSNSFTHVWSQSACHVPLNEWLNNKEYARMF